MSLIARISRGQGPFWGTLKRFANAVLQFHVPVFGITKPFFAGLYWLHVTIREGVLWCTRFFWYEPLFRSQCAKVGSRFRMEQLPYLMGRGKIFIGDSVSLSGKSSFAFNNRHRDTPELVIGDHTFIGHQCSFRSAESIRIGRHCLIAGSVTIGDYDGHPLDAARRRAGETSPAADVKPVEIGDDVWIGAGAVILKGVTIGSRSIVGTRAVVTKDVPPDTIVAGNPAVVVKQLAEAGATDG